jgi:hypothetical protein
MGMLQKEVGKGFFTDIFYYVFISIIEFRWYDIDGWLSLYIETHRKCDNVYSGTASSQQTR